MPGWSSIASKLDGTKARMWTASREAKLSDVDPERMMGRSGNSGEKQDSSEREMDLDLDLDLDADTIWPEDSISTVNLDLGSGRGRDFPLRRGKENGYFEGATEGTIYNDHNPHDMGMGSYGSGHGLYGHSRPRTSRSAEPELLSPGMANLMEDRGLSKGYGAEDVPYYQSLQDAFYPEDDLIGGSGPGLSSSTMDLREALDIERRNRKYFHSTQDRGSFRSNLHKAYPEDGIFGGKTRDPLLERDIPLNQGGPYEDSHFSRRIFLDPSRPYATVSGYGRPRPRGRTFPSFPPARNHLPNRILLSRTTSIPGKRVVRTLGIASVGGEDVGLGLARSQLEEKEQEQMLCDEMRKLAKADGADAVIEIMVTKGRRGQLVMQGLLVQTAPSSTSQPPRMPLSTSGSSSLPNVPTIFTNPHVPRQQTHRTPLSRRSSQSSTPPMSLMGEKPSVSRMRSVFGERGLEMQNEMRSGMGVMNDGISMNLGDEMGRSGMGGGYRLGGRYY